jgi:hypothetical protein
MRGDLTPFEEAFFNQTVAQRAQELIPASRLATGAQRWP